MGCCISSMITQKPTNITSNLKDNKYLDENDDQILNLKTSPAVEIKTVKDWKFTEGILVKETKADPYAIYDSLKVLGEGAFGKVEKVRHKISKQIRAMKIIHKDQIQLGSEEEQALIKEINIVKTLDHPNIMKVFEYYNNDNCLFIISELLSGGELFDKIKENKFLKEEVCAYLMKQIFSAVDFCHEKKIIHRDLKPENVLIESEEEARKEFFTVKLIDFGTSDKMKKGQKFRFDQSGIVMYLDSDNWFKASVEYEDDKIQRLGAVVTQNGYSDWSSSDIPANIKDIWFRFSRRESDFYVEFSEDGNNWKQMRMFHMFKGGEEISFGIYACSPGKQASFEANFTNMEFTECTWEKENN